MYSGKLIYYGYAILKKKYVYKYRYFSKIVIETYSKYVWVESLKNKTEKECTKGMFYILKNANPKVLQTDNGTAFNNTQFQDWIKQYKIGHFSSYSVIDVLNWWACYTSSKYINISLKLQVHGYIIYKHIYRWTYYKKVGNKIFVKWLGFDSCQKNIDNIIRYLKIKIFYV